MRTFYTEKSSRVVALEYDPSTGDLDIVYTRGGVYRYFEVPSEVFDGLILSESIGKAINDRIKGHFKFKKLS